MKEGLWRQAGRALTVAALVTVGLAVNANSAPAEEPAADEVMLQAASENGRIAFVSSRDGNREIYSMEPDGSDVRRLTDDPAADSNPDFSPDGRSISFERYAGEHHAVYAMDADGSNVRKLTEPSGDFGGPAFSPDGRKIAYYDVRDGGLYTMNADGSGKARIPVDGPGFHALPEWSPDGSNIAFSSDREALSGDIWAVKATGGEPWRIAGADPHSHDIDPAWSPDGTKIAYLAYPPWFSGPGDGAPHGVYVADAAGGSGRGTLLFENALSGPAWSPDGERFAYQAQAEDGGVSIFVADADGTNPVRLTGATTIDMAPDWGPDPSPTISLSAGSDTGASASDRLTNDPTPTLAGTAGPGATVTVSEGDAEVGSATTDDSGEWSLETSPLPDGERDLTAVAADARGDLSTPSEPLRVTVDTRVPEVASVSPEKDTDAAPTTGEVTATFSEPLDPATVDDSSFVLREEDSTPVAASVLYDAGSRTATLDPDEPLRAGASYGATVDVAVRDPAGNDLAVAYSWGFGVNSAPGVSRISPADGARVRDRTPRIGATVEDDQTDLRKTDVALYVDGRQRPRFSYDEKTDRLNHTTGRLSYGTHSVRVVAVDHQGLRTARSWRFEVRRR